jgi:stage II sporulation protein D
VVPFKDDRRSQRLGQGVATALCGAVLWSLYAVSVETPSAVVSNQPPALQIRRPAAAVSAARAVSQPAARKPEPVIRINLTPAPQAQLSVGVRGPYVIRAVGSGDVLQRGEELAEANVKGSSSGITIGKKSFHDSRIEIVPAKSDLVVAERHAYHGSLQIERQKSGKLTAINVVALEQYVSGVIDAEMPAAFPPAAREAQAIVARTYALWQMQHAEPAAHYDVFATVRSQKYLGVDYVNDRGRKLAGESASSRAAAAATRGKVCVSQGKLFCTYYSAVCGGRTNAGREIFDDADAVLRSVPCEWCSESDKYRWNAELSLAEFKTGLKKALGGKAPSDIKTIRQTAGPGAGVIAHFEIGDGKKSTTVNGIALRQSLPNGKLLSPHFAMRLQSGKVHFEGQGFGHGAGLCQWGARGQAQSGKLAVEIVRYYYPGADISDWGY